MQIATILRMFLKDTLDRSVISLYLFFQIPNALFTYILAKD